MTEWIPSLSTRKKWLHERKNLQVNDVVLLISPDSCRAHWPLGHVIEVYPGKVGLVLGGINFRSHDYCVKFNTVITILYTYYSMSIYTIEVKL